jgi:hypothetical protein
MHRAGFVPYGPSRAGSEALSRIMAANSVVTKDVPDQTIVGAVPARVIKTIVPRAGDSGPQWVVLISLVSPPRPATRLTRLLSYQPERCRSAHRQCSRTGLLR